MSTRTSRHLKRIALGFVLAIGMVWLVHSLPSGIIPTVNKQTTRQDARFEGHVIRIADGDSLTVRANDENVAVRLAEIDAPERGQPWGTKSRQELSSLVGGQTVTIQPKGQDRYGRTLAIVWLDGRNINREMVARGAAWAYRAYQTDPSFSEAQGHAQRTQSGLWAMAEGERIPPWDYRAQQRAQRTEAVAR